jgi:hypothetical protein
VGLLIITGLNAESCRSCSPQGHFSLESNLWFIPQTDDVSTETNPRCPPCAWFLHATVDYVLLNRGA